ncbi:MAG: isochorismatase family protein, partial [Acidimicrobiia bacterium]|nr:isochorismatase family protein [Acidimicrobiia bacterium]
MEFSPRTALVVVDVQHDFADPEGSLFVAGGPETVPVVNALIGEAVDAGATVAYTQDWHPPSTPHFARDGGVWPVHCVGGTVGSAFHPDLDIIEGAPIVRKGVGGEDGYSGFTMRDPLSGEAIPTDLADEIRTRGATEVVVVGLALDYCVRDTALDAARLGFDTTVVA